MTNIYEDRKTRLIPVLESLKVQGLGLLSRGDVTDDELNAFRDVGEALLAGTDFTLLDGSDCSGEGPEIDLELSLETLGEVIETLSEDRLYTSESMSPEKESPVVKELLEYRDSLEALEKTRKLVDGLKRIELSMSKDERDEAYEEQDKILTNALGNSDGFFNMLYDVMTAPVRAVTKAAGRKLVEKTGALGSVVSDAIRGAGRDIDQATTTHESLKPVIQMVDSAIDYHRRHNS